MMSLLETNTKTGTNTSADIGVASWFSLLPLGISVVVNLATHQKPIRAAHPCMS